MAKSTGRLELRVGLLIVGGLAALVIVILISDKFSFDRYYKVTGYLDNAGDLQQGSPVTLAGIPIGKVSSVDSVQDSRGQIKVVMMINEEYELPADSKLTLSTRGILGDSYLSFSGSGQMKEKLPTDGSATVTASQGFFDEASSKALAIMTGVADLLDQPTRDNAKKLVAEAAKAAEGTVLTLEKIRGEAEQLHELMASMKDLSTQLQLTTHILGEKATETLAQVDKSLANIDDQSQKIVASTEPTLQAATVAFTRMDEFLGNGTALMQRNQQEFDTLISNLRRLSERGARLVSDLQEGKGVIGQLLVNPDLTKDLNDISINLAVASEQIADHPEALVFGVSNKDHIKLRERRERMRMRRSFQEGFYTTPPAEAEETSEQRAASLK
jgi:phospholipid/cholesterol/gamma-HCH transport system substrate-binding protein